MARPVNRRLYAYNYLQGLQAGIDAQFALLEHGQNHVEVPHILQTLLVVNVGSVPANDGTNEVAAELLAGAREEANEPWLLHKVAIQPDKTCSHAGRSGRASNGQQPDGLIQQ